MTSIIADETSLTRSIAGFLLDKGCYEALNSLLLETNTPLYDSLPNEFIHLQRMILQGRWNDILSFVGPLCDANSRVGKDINLLIGKQQYLESLSWQGGGADRWIFPPWRPNLDRDPKFEDNVELNMLIALLNSLKPLCSVAEFNSLCLFLTLERLEDHPEYANWSVSAGRYNCCSQLLKLLLEVFQESSLSSLITNKQLLSKLVTYAVEDIIDKDNHQLLQSKLVTNQSGVKAVHLKSLEDVLPIVDKRKSQRVTWSNRVKVQTRSSTAAQTMTLPNNFATTVRPSSASQQGIVSRRTLDVDDRKAHSSTMDFANTVPWPSANGGGEKVSAQPLHSSEEDPFFNSQDMADQSRSNNTTRPTTQNSEPKKAMSWTVDVSDGTDANHVPHSGSNSRKNLHNRESGDGRNLPQRNPTTVSASAAVQQPKVTPRSNSRDTIDSEPNNGSDLRLSRSKIPGLTSPYSSQDISAAPVGASEIKSPGKSRTASSPSPTKRGARPATSSRINDHASAVSSSTRKGVLWDDSCPLRCISVLEENTSDGAVTAAVGTNAKAVHLVQFRPRDLDTLTEETLKGAASSGTDILDMDGIVQDMTQHVQHIYTFEKVHNGSVYAMDYHRGSATLVTASNDKAVRIIKPNTRQLCTAMKGHTGTIRIVKFAPETEAAPIAASAGAGDFRPRLWDIQAESCQRILTEHKATIHGMVWINDQVLVTGCEAGILTAHDVRDRHPIWSYSLTELLQQTPGYRDAVARSVCALEYIPLLASPSSGLPKPVPGTFTPSALGSILAVGCLNGSVSFLQTDTSPAKVVLDMPQAHSADVRTLLALPDYHYQRSENPLVFSASYDATANLWACAGAQRRTDPLLQCTNRATLRAGHTDKVLCAAALQSSASIITSGADGRVVLWNLPH